MSYTNLDLVKKHISLDEIPSGPKRDYPVVFVEQEWVNLTGRAIAENSVSVKAVCNYAPECEEKTLGDGLVSLANDRLVSGSVTIASDSSLGTIYRENVDYCVDCDNGTVRRLEEGEIAAGTEVTIWYYYYSVYAEGADYQLNYQDGMIRRLPTGDIQAGQTVLVDYTLSANQLNDEILSEAVSEANAVIERQIDPDRQFGADLTLQAAGTYLAVSLICRIAAASDLKFSAYGRQSAPAWLSLSESYRTDYEKLLKIFRPQAARLNRPTHS